MPTCFTVKATENPIPTGDYCFFMWGSTFRCESSSSLLACSVQVTGSCFVSRRAICEITRKIGGEKEKILMDDYAYRESCSNWVNLNLHVVARFGLWDKDYETCDTRDSVTLTACFFDFKLVLFAFLNWLVERSCKVHTSDFIQFLQLVFWEGGLHSFHGTIAFFLTWSNCLAPYCGQDLMFVGSRAPHWTVNESYPDPHYLSEPNPHRWSFRAIRSRCGSAVLW